MLVQIGVSFEPSAPLETVLWAFEHWTFIAEVNQQEIRRRPLMYLRNDPLLSHRWAVDLNWPIKEGDEITSRLEKSADAPPHPGTGPDIKIRTDLVIDGELELLGNPLTHPRLYIEQ